MLARILLVISLLWATDSFAKESVDTALVLLVDCSGSIDAVEYELQRQGYADAISSPEVVKAITQSGYGKIAITVIEWSGHLSQSTIVPWMTIASAEDAERVAHLIRKSPEAKWRQTAAGQTSISGALEAAIQAFAALPYEAERKIVDVSGDGINNGGVMPDANRDILLSMGVTINGLIILVDTQEPVLDFYLKHVIGGLGSFYIEVKSFGQFPEAVRRKIVVELG